MTRRHSRLVLSLVALGITACAVGLALWALQDTVTYFYNPTQLAAMPVTPAKRVRVGGLVLMGSLDMSKSPLVRFIITDTNSQIHVAYSGSVPDLFREGQGVIAEGEIGPDSVLRASVILAKHDERYMPQEVVRALKAQHYWRDGSPPRSGTKPSPPARPKMPFSGSK